MSTIEIVSESPAGQGWVRRAQAAGTLSVIAGLAHLWATPEHSGGWWGYGAFFLGVGLAQTLYGFLLPFWPNPLLHAAAIWGNVGVILIYVVTRTGGIPIGPHAGIVEDVRLFDLATTVIELGLVVVLVSLLADALRAWTLNVLLLTGAAVWVLRLTGSLP
jgi:hypothetical protein